MKTVFFMAIVLFVIWANIALAVSSRDIVLYYAFDEGSGKDVIDCSGNGMSGEISGNPERIDGVFGGALDLKGVANEYVQILDLLPIGSGSSTVAMWIRVPSNAAGRVGIVLGNYPDPRDGSNSGSNMELHDDGQMRMWWNDSRPQLYATTDLRDDEWHHIAYVRDTDDDEFRMYIDAKEEELPDTDFGAGDDIELIMLHRIGADNRGAAAPWLQSAIDDFVIYTRVLAEDELEELMARPALAVHLAGKLASTWGGIKVK